MPGLSYSSYAREVSAGSRLIVSIKALSKALRVSSHKER